MTTNIFEAVLGNKKAVAGKNASPKEKAVKWDAFWHLFEWLLNAKEGHGLGDSIRSQLIKYAFGVQGQGCKILREYPIKGQTDGKGKWADLALGIPDLDHPKYLILMDDIPHASSGGIRKLDNLNAYVALSLQHHPHAIIRSIAVTDASAGTELATVVYTQLKAEATDYTSQTGWKLLPLKTIGEWVRGAMDSPTKPLDHKMKMILEDLVEWCRGASA